MKILLVDDKPENLLALESLLKSPQIECLRASSGMEALELLLIHEFALAILDVQMPEMDGFELAELMRGTEQTRSIPIIFVTAGVHDRFNTFRGYEKGAVDFIYKPIDSHIIKNKVQIFMELARQKQLLKSQLNETKNALKERDQALMESKEALRTRDEFLSIASHELKTPLTSLYLQLQLMNRIIMRDQAREINNQITLTSPSLADRLSRGLQVCEKQSEKLSSLLDELLDLTRVRLGKLQLMKEAVNLSEVIGDVIERFKNEIDQRGCAINITVDSTIIGHWDPTRIDQVITNLVSNAIKYGNSKPVSIHAELNKTKDTVTVIITDQGIGIPDEMQEKIFQRFERAVSGNQISGLGLGLYITKQIVEAHGGSISVKSEKNKGSTFIVTIPLNQRCDH